MGDYRVLVLTGHFPPEVGGVQTFTWELVRRLPADRLLVVAPAWPGAAEFDAELDFPVVRRHGYLLFRGLRELVARHRAEVGWITAAAPFGLYGPLMRAAGLNRLICSTHGQELGWCRAAPTRAALCAAARGFDVLTYLSASTREVLARAVGDRTRLVQLAGGVDTERFRPGLDGTIVRNRHGLGDGPVVLSIARLVHRKGHDILVRAWPDVVRRFPDARLVIVGDGPMRSRLQAMAADLCPGTVTLTGQVPSAELPGYYAAADVFVMPCRDDRHGLQTEGLGLSTLEASAAGLPVVVGRSGGSPESVVDGETGVLLDVEPPGALAGILTDLLADPDRVRSLGRSGSGWVREHWSWERAADRLAALLSGEPVDPERVVGEGRGKTSGWASRSN
jgi:glycosyltransferase involved in cell wall biosynthesis